jgi:hypothetical protein
MIVGVEAGDDFGDESRRKTGALYWDKASDGSIRVERFGL